LKKIKDPPPIKYSSSVTCVCVWRVFFFFLVWPGAFFFYKKKKNRELLLTYMGADYKVPTPPINPKIIKKGKKERRSIFLFFLLFNSIRSSSGYCMCLAASCVDARMYVGSRGLTLNNSHTHTQVKVGKRENC
jgi:hypothetical protein